MTAGMFTMCGHGCPSHPELRCELASGHDKPTGLLTSVPTRHLSGRVEWGSDGKHKHLSPMEQLFRSINPHHVPAGRAYAFNTDGLWDFTSRQGVNVIFSTADEAKNLKDGLTPEAQLAGWWREKAEAEIEQTVAKAVEYGSTDLIDIGNSIARAAGRELEGDDEAAEWGIFFYLEGKLSRWRSAITDGRRVSDDTLLDIGVYARMAQRVREVGQWPGVENGE